MFEILLTSPPDRENLVAEIWLKNELIGEVSHECENYEIELYFPGATNSVKIEFNSFIEALTKAKERLQKVKEQSD